jgi:hypothetical protein
MSHCLLSLQDLQEISAISLVERWTRSVMYSTALHFECWVEGIGDPAHLPGHAHVRERNHVLAGVQEAALTPTGGCHHPCTSLGNVN